jgi:hypothetical protein
MADRDRAAAGPVGPTGPAPAASPSAEAKLASPDSPDSPLLPAAALDEKLSKAECDELERAPEEALVADREADAQAMRSRTARALGGLLGTLRLKLFTLDDTPRNLLASTLQAAVSLERAGSVCGSRNADAPFARPRLSQGSKHFAPTTQVVLVEGPLVTEAHFAAARAACPFRILPGGDVDAGDGDLEAGQHRAAALTPSASDDATLAKPPAILRLGLRSWSTALLDVYLRLTVAPVNLGRKRQMNAAVCGLFWLPLPLVLLADGLVYPLVGLLACLDVVHWFVRSFGRAISTGTLLALARTCVLESVRSAPKPPGASEETIKALHDAHRAAEHALVAQFRAQFTVSHHSVFATAGLFLVFALAVLIQAINIIANLEGTRLYISLGLIFAEGAVSGAFAMIAKRGADGDDAAELEQRRRALRGERFRDPFDDLPPQVRRREVICTTLADHSIRSDVTSGPGGCFSLALSALGIPLMALMLPGLLLWARLNPKLAGQSSSRNLVAPVAGTAGLIVNVLIFDALRFLEQGRGLVFESLLTEALLLTGALLMAAFMGMQARERVGTSQMITECLCLWVCGEEADGWRKD